jgi:hypothetical protein
MPLISISVRKALPAGFFSVVYRADDAEILTLIREDDEPVTIARYSVNLRLRPFIRLI